MANKRTSLASIARPQGGEAKSTAQRVDVLQNALDEAGISTRPAKKNKQQRNRAGMVSVSIWMSEQARFDVKMFAANPRTSDGKETMEGFIIRAVNSQLEKEGADFQIGNGDVEESE